MHASEDASVREHRHDERERHEDQLASERNPRCGIVLEHGMGLPHRVDYKVRDSFPGEEEQKAHRDDVEMQMCRLVLAGEAQPDQEAVRGERDEELESAQPIGCSDAVIEAEK